MNIQSLKVHKLQILKGSREGVRFEYPQKNEYDIALKIRWAEVMGHPIQQLHSCGEYMAKGDVILKPCSDKKENCTCSLERI